MTKIEPRWLGPYQENDRFADKVTVQYIVDLKSQIQELEDYLDRLEKYIVNLENGIIDSPHDADTRRILDVRFSDKS